MGHPNLHKYKGSDAYNVSAVGIGDWYSLRLKLGPLMFPL